MQSVNIAFLGLSCLRDNTIFKKAVQKKLLGISEK